MATTLTRDGPVAILRLDEPRGNALSFATIGRIGALLDEVEASDARALVWTGTGGTFCTGLDLRELIEKLTSAPDERLGAFIDAFESLFLRVFTFRRPVIAAVNGHAIAGGAVIALCCDLRMMTTTSAARFALRETELGIPFPSIALAACQFALPPEQHMELIAFARALSPEECLQRRVVHELADDPLARAVARAHEVSRLGARAVRDTKLTLRVEAIRRAMSLASDSRAAFATAFLDDDAQQRIRGLLATLHAKARG